MYNITSDDEKSANAFNDNYHLHTVMLGVRGRVCARGQRGEHVNITFDVEYLSTSNLRYTVERTLGIIKTVQKRRYNRQMFDRSLFTDSLFVSWRDVSLTFTSRHPASLRRDNN